MLYSLKTISGYLQLPPDTIRKWEARYQGLISPARQNNGYRQYDDEDLRRLQIFSQARLKGKNGKEALRLAQQPAEIIFDFKLIRQNALSALEHFDRTEVQKLFRESMSKVGSTNAFTHLWLPVLAELGLRAHTGEAFWISVEHFASGFLREEILSKISKRHNDGKSQIAICSLEGDRHELGMLLATSSLEEKRIRTLYLGPDLPLESLSAALERLRPKALALCLTTRRTRQEFKSDLLLIKGRYPKIMLFVCGQESLRHANLIRQLGAFFIGTDLDRGVASISEKLQGSSI